MNVNDFEERALLRGELEIRSKYAIFRRCFGVTGNDPCESYDEFRGKILKHRMDALVHDLKLRHGCADVCRECETIIESWKEDSDAQSN